MATKKERVKARVASNKVKYLKVSKGDAWYDIEKLVCDESIYPRRNILSSKVNQYKDAMELGQIFPAITVETRNERPTGRILDGWHRYHALLKQGAKEISVTYVECKDDVEALRQSYILNNTHGLAYSAIEVQDYVKTANDLGMSYDMIAEDINKTPKKVQTMVKNFGTAKDGSTIALKRGLRHLRDNSNVTKKQEALNKAWIGSSANVYVSLLYKYLDANAFKTDDVKFVKLMDKLTDKWMQIRKTL